MSQVFPFLIVRLDKFRSLPTGRPQDSVLGCTHGLDLLTPVQEPGGVPLETLEFYYCKEISTPFFPAPTKASLESVFFRSILPFRNDSFCKRHLERRRQSHCPLLDHRGPWCFHREHEPQINPSSRDNFKMVLGVPLALLGKQMTRCLKKKPSVISLSFVGTLCLNDGFSSP